MNLACFNKEALAAAKKRVDNKAERKNKSLQNDDEEEEKAPETKAKPANEKELVSATCVLVYTLAFPEATTEKAATKARDEKVSKDVKAKPKKSKEFDEIEKKLEDTNLKGNQTKVTQFLKLEKAEALAAAKIKNAVKKTEKEVVVAARKKVKKALASAKLDEEKAAVTKIKT